MNRKLYRFLHALTGEQQVEFAKAAKTTVGTLRHYVTERRFASSAMAIALEKSAARMRAHDSDLPALGRRDLSTVCRGCEYAKRCLAEDNEPLA